MHRIHRRHVALGRLDVAARRDGAQRERVGRGHRVTARMASRRGAWSACRAGQAVTQADPGRRVEHRRHEEGGSDGPEERRHDSDIRMVPKSAKCNPSTAHRPNRHKPAARRPPVGRERRRHDRIRIRTDLRGSGPRRRYRPIDSQRLSKQGACRGSASRGNPLPACRRDVIAVTCFFIDETYALIGSIVRTIWTGMPRTEY